MPPGRAAGGPPGSRRRCPITSRPAGSDGWWPRSCWSCWPIVVFAGGLRGLAVDVAVLDDAVVGWLAGLDPPGLAGPVRGAGRPRLLVGPEHGLAYGLVLALLVLRRFRHLILSLIVTTCWRRSSWRAGAGHPAAAAVRGRDPGRLGRLGHAVAAGHLLGGWTWWRSCTRWCPEGRWRNSGKWLATGLVALAAAGPDRAGRRRPDRRAGRGGPRGDHPAGCLPLFAPNEVFPITYRRGRSAHLDVSGARGAAIRRGLEDQLGLVVTEVKPFGLAGSAGSTPLRITVKGDPPHLAVRQAVRPQPPALGPLVQARPRAALRPAGGREAVQHRAAAGPAGGLRAVADAAGPACPARPPTASSSSPPSGSTCWSPSSSTARSSSARPRSTSQIIDDGLGIIRKLWDAGLAHRDIKPANLLVRDGRLLLIDVAFVEVRPSPWRQAVDLANMMLCLALRSTRSWSTSGPCGSSRSRRSPRGSPPPAGWPCPRSCGGCCGPRAATCTPSSCGCCRPRPGRCRSSAGAGGGSGSWAAGAGSVALVALIGRGSSLDYNGSAVADPAGLDSLACTDLEPLWLLAQSVPSASLVPCVRSLPVGWSLGEVAVNDGRSVISLNHDRAGAARPGGPADRQLRRHRGGRGAVGDGPGVRRYQRIERPPRRFTVVLVRPSSPGGCVTTRMQLTTDRERASSPARPPASSASPPATSSPRPSSRARTAASTSTRSGGARWERPSGTRRSCTTGRSAS